MALLECLLTNNSHAVSVNSTTLLVSRRLTSLLEAVLEATSHRLQILHATRSLTTTAGALQSPIVYTHVTPAPRPSSQPTMSHLGIRVSTRTAAALLNVESTTVASSADRVSLGVFLTKRGSTLGLRTWLFPILAIPTPPIFYPSPIVQQHPLLSKPLLTISLLGRQR